ncbi:MAG TPA: DUF4157 domain-containing protein, partial [Polyangiaceae bacterium]|nr:DUF4157 domain-containing protein [Polyangiaceae bacterium]
MQLNALSQRAAVEVDGALQGPEQNGGEPLGAGLRDELEHAFDWDFSAVRVHADREAARGAAALGAQAFTSGRHIFFSSQSFAPETEAGRRLLTHELAHVTQHDRSPSVDGPLRAKPDAGKGKPKTTTRPFTIMLNGKALDAQQLQREFVRQYYDLTTDAEIEAKLRLWSTPARGTTDAEVKRGRVQANVTTANETDFGELSLEEKDAVNAETDRRFWGKTNYKPGQKLGRSAQDQQMAKRWLATRNSVLAEDLQRKRIDALPEDIKRVLFAGDSNAASLTPDDYGKALSIAEKLAQLRPEQRQDYLARINARTTSLEALDRSVDDYIALQQNRARQAQEIDQTAKPLMGRDELYKQYRFWKLYGQKVTLGGDASKEDQELADSMTESIRVNLLKALQDQHINSIAEFEANIEAYRVGFRTHAVNLALDVLARYEHFLFEERTKLEKPGAPEAIAQGIASSGAAKAYAEAHEHEGTARNLEFAHEPKETWWIKPHQEAKNRAAAARSSAEAAVNSGSGNDPLVAERGIDREKLAGLGPKETRAFLFKELVERERAAASARKDFIDDPDRVFKLPDLISAAKELHSVAPGTVFNSIIDDFISDEASKHLISEIIKGVLVLALALLVPGGGWVAAAALVGSAALSAHGAYEAYRQYETDSRDYELHFLSEEPSLFWVGVAIAGAALDLGVAASALIKTSAAGLKALRGPLQEFAKEGDVAKLLAQIQKAEGLDLKVKQALERSLEAEQLARAAQK